MLQRELLYAALGTGFTCLATVLGAGMVFFFKKDLYFIGEVIDVDRYTGGYNLQIAFATAYACGSGIAENI